MRNTKISIFLSAIFTILILKTDFLNSSDFKDYESETCEKTSANYATTQKNLDSDNLSTKPQDAFFEFMTRLNTVEDLKKLSLLNKNFNFMVRKNLQQWVNGKLNSLIIENLSDDDQSQSAKTSRAAKEALEYFDITEPQIKSNNFKLLIKLLPADKTFEEGLTFIFNDSYFETNKNLKEFENYMGEYIWNEICNKMLCHNKRGLKVIPLQFYKFDIKALHHVKHTLMVLDFSDYNISTWPSNTDPFLMIERLNLSYNNLSNIPEIITSLQNLRLLNVSYNKIEQLPEKISDLADLRHLIVSNNCLRNLPQSILKFEKIVLLDIKKNFITSLPKGLEKIFDYDCYPFLTLDKSLRTDSGQLEKVAKENRPYLCWLNINYV